MMADSRRQVHAGRRRKGAAPGQGQRDARPLPARTFPKGAIGDDPIEPRSEKADCTPERVDLGDDIHEGVLNNLLRVLGVRRDADGQDDRLGCGTP